MKLLSTLILAIILTFLYIIWPNKAIDVSVMICKKGNKVKVDYMNSTSGIYKVGTLIKGDTLLLRVYVSHFITNNVREISLPDGVRFVQYGKFTKEVDKLNSCHTVRSGQEAMDYLKGIR